MEMDEAFNPIEAGLLHGGAVMLKPDSVADAVEQARRGRRIHRRTGLGSAIGTPGIDFRGFSGAAPYGKRTMDAFFSVSIRLYIFRWAS